MAVADQRVVEIDENGVVFEIDPGQCRDVPLDEVDLRQRQRRHVAAEVVVHGH